MKRKKSKPLRRATLAISRRPPATAKMPRKLAKQIKSMQIQIESMQIKIESMQVKIDDFGMLNTTLHTKIGKISNLERHVEAAEMKVMAIRAEVNALQPLEPHSGTRASTLGIISEEGGIPIDGNAVKDAGILSNKT